MSARDPLPWKDVQTLAGDFGLSAADDQAALLHVRAAQMMRPVQCPGLEALVPGGREVGRPHVGIYRQGPLARLDQSDKSLARRGTIEVVVERLDLRQLVPHGHGPGQLDLPLSQAMSKDQLLLVGGVDDAVREAVVPRVLAFDEQQQGLCCGSCGTQGQGEGAVGCEGGGVRRVRCAQNADPPLPKGVVGCAQHAAADQRPPAVMGPVLLLRGVVPVRPSDDNLPAGVGAHEELEVSVPRVAVDRLLGPRGHDQGTAVRSRKLEHPCLAGLALDGPLETSSSSDGVEGAAVVRGRQGKIGAVRRPRRDLQNVCRGPGGPGHQRARQRQQTQLLPLPSQNHVPPYKIGTPSLLRHKNLSRQTKRDSNSLP